MAGVAGRAMLLGAVVLAAGCNTILGYAAGDPSPAGSGGSNGGGAAAGTGGPGGGSGGSGASGAGGVGGVGGPSGGSGGLDLGDAIKLIDVVRTADGDGARPGGEQPIPAMADIGNGTLCWRVQVFSVPSTALQSVQFCFWQVFGSIPEACSEGTDIEGAGTFHYEQSIDTLWANGGVQVDWSATGNMGEAMFKVGACCSGDLTVAPGGQCGDYCYDGDLTPFVPRRARETAYMVPEGQSCPDLDVVAGQTEPVEL